VPLWVAEGDAWRPPPGQDLRPVESVSADDAEAFARFERARLPTPAEWLWAARGPFPAGTSPVPLLLGAEGIRVDRPADGPSDVGRTPADRGAFGLLDVLGNVAELAASPGSGEGAGPAYVVLGGGYATSVRRAVSAEGLPVPREEPLPGVGFRLVRPGP
jgi:formylglycine-generating enzyme required for sulfatase activity